jgi:CRISPR-associated protein Cmr3
MISLFIEPNDVLLFRDGRSFSAGSDHSAVGLFPPLPSTFYGALRSAILSIRHANFALPDFGFDRDMTTILGTKLQLGALSIGHFSLARKHESSLTLIFPMPFNVLQNKLDGGRTLARPLNDRHGVRTNGNGKNLLWVHRSERSFLEGTDGYLTGSEFDQFLNGMVPEPISYSVFDKEPRTGIAIDRKTKTTTDGNLFAVEFIRLNHGIGFVVRLDNTGSVQLERGVIRLGGESRTAFYHTCAEPVIVSDTIKRKVKESKRFLIVLTTPAVFGKGWVPDGINDDLKGKIGGCEVSLTGAAVGRYRIVGGWDMANNKPKQSNRAVPAGSVYFFEIQSGDIDGLFASVFGKSICEDIISQRLGLGISYIGGY